MVYAVAVEVGGAVAAIHRLAGPTAPAIANAIAQAIGVRLTALPLTPERVWQALRGARDTLPPCEAEA